MNDWLQVLFYVLGPTAIAGVIWVFMGVNELRKDHALTKQVVGDIQAAMKVQADMDIPGRVIKLETTNQFILESQKRIEGLVSDVSKTTQRIEVLVAKNTPIAS